MVKLLLIAVGGAVGSVGRYLLSGFANRISNAIHFPVGTLTVNLIGSFIIGLLWGWFEHNDFSSPMRSLLFVGILGGFTTFSAFSLETLILFRDGHIKIALLNVILNNVVGIGLAFLGYALTRQLSH
jgi:fluoride exporter